MPLPLLLESGPSPCEARDVARRLEPYCWPLRPFHKPHPVRAYFNDPRISGSSRAFHFGIDISARDGAAVYAVEPGTVHFEGGRSLSVVSSGGGRSLGYWHVVPAVRHRQAVRQHQLLGHVEAPWGHVHFAESSRRQYRNPLRKGALTPWLDPSSPRIAGIVFSRDGKVIRPWHAPVDFRRTLLPPSLFAVVFAPGTRQNRPNRPGRYRFFVARSWSTRRLRNGLYRIEVSASDVHGNRAQASLPFTIANRR